MTLATTFTTIRRIAARSAPLSRWRSIVLAFAIALFIPPALAEGIAVSSAAIEPADDGWNLEAAFDVQFSQRLEEAVNRGVPLYFVVEFELSRPRWYWFDEKPVRLSQTYKIS